MGKFQEALVKFEKYKTPTGLYSLYTDGEKGIETQNGALFTVECLGVIYGITHESDLILLDNIRDNAHRALEDLENEEYSGLYHRVKGGKETNSFDNMTAHVALGPVVCKKILRYGETMVCTDSTDTKFQWLAYILGGFKTRYVWNCENPTKYKFFGWHGRSPAYMAQLRYMSDNKMTFWRAFVILVGQFIGSWNDKNDTDARKLPYITWQWLKNVSPFWKFAYKVWCKILLSKYPNGMKDVYKIYYGDPNHPIHEYSIPYLP